MFGGGKSLTPNSRGGNNTMVMDKVPAASSVAEVSSALHNLFPISGETTEGRRQRRRKLLLQGGKCAI